jgi:hypothetical protein
VLAFTGIVAAGVVALSEHFLQVDWKYMYLLRLCEKKTQARENIVMSEVYSRSMEGEEE